LRLLPWDVVTRAKVSDAGYNPHLQIKTPLSKRVDAIFKHMVNKWGSMAYSDLANIRLIFKEGTLGSGLGSGSGGKLGVPGAACAGGTQSSVGGMTEPCVKVWSATQSNESLLMLVRSLPPATLTQICEMEVLHLSYTFKPPETGAATAAGSAIARASRVAESVTGSGTGEGRVATPGTEARTVPRMVPARATGNPGAKASHGSGPANMKRKARERRGVEQDLPAGKRQRATGNQEATKEQAEEDTGGGVRANSRATLEAETGVLAARTRGTKGPLEKVKLSPSLAAAPPVGPAVSQATKPVDIVSLPLSSWVLKAPQSSVEGPGAGGDKKAHSLDRQPEGDACPPRVQLSMGEQETPGHVDQQSTFPGGGEARALTGGGKAKDRSVGVGRSDRGVGLQVAASEGQEEG
ncbi:unnamed protein product, partial [Discosporangium mesarthrocarpum]